MKRCTFCETVMDEVSQHSMGPDEWRCPRCGAVEGIGVRELPDPDRLREQAEELEQLADEIENGDSAVVRALRS